MITESSLAVLIPGLHQLNGVEAVHLQRVNCLPGHRIKQTIHHHIKVVRWSHHRVALVAQFPGVGGDIQV